MSMLAKVKQYCRIDTTEDDQMLQGLIAAAINLIKEQSGKNAYVGDGSSDPAAIEDTELFQICVCQLVEHWYDRRGAVDGQQQNHIPFATDMLIAHFKYSCEYALLSPAPEPTPDQEPEPEPEPEPEDPPEQNQQEQQEQEEQGNGT